MKFLSILGDDIYRILGRIKSDPAYYANYNILLSRNQSLEKFLTVRSP